jgi:hypothetical protein
MNCFFRGGHGALRNGSPNSKPKSVGKNARLIPVQNRARFDEIDREQLAAQIVSVMDAHFQRPSTEEKRHILRVA